MVVQTSSADFVVGRLTVLIGVLRLIRSSFCKPSMGGHSGRSDVAKEPHKDFAEVARCFLYSAFDAVLSCSASRPITFTFFVRQVPNANFSSPLSVTRDFLSTAGCSSAEFGACLFLAFIGPGLEASPIRFPSKPPLPQYPASRNNRIGVACSMPIIRAPNSPISSDMEILIFGGPSHS